MIAKFDGDSNEAKGLNFEKFPTLIYFPKANKDKSALKYNGPLNIETFA